MAVNNYYRFFIVGFLVCVFSSANYAAPSDQDQPVTVEANSAQLDDKGGMSVYSGNVSIIQGALHITADKVTAYHKSGGINKIIATGNPAHYEQTGDSKGGAVHASADTINYLTDERKVVLTGHAQLEQQGNTVQGQTITYDMKRKIGSAGGNSNGKSSQPQEGRVKMIFQPKSKSDKKPSTETKTP